MLEKEGGGKEVEEGGGRGPFLSNLRDDRDSALAFTAVSVSMSLIQSSCTLLLAVVLPRAPRA